MDTITGSLRHIFDMANKTQVIWCAVIILTMLILAVLHHRWKDDAKKLRLWRLLCLIPLLTAIAHALIYVLGFPVIVSAFIPLYIIAFVSLFPILFAKRRIGYRITAVITGLITALCGLYFCLSAPNFSNYTRKSYSDSFHALAEFMDRKYILKEWKEVDFTALEAKYMPAVKEAEQENDPAKFADAVTLFCNELHDGHVSVDRNYDTKAYTSAFQQHEYGLAMVQLDSGEVIAVCTSEEVNKLGIEDGTVITKWNGRPVLQTAAEDVMDMGSPVKANEERIAAINLSGTGGDTVEVSFLDSSGSEQTVTLSDLGEMHTLQEAFCAFAHAPRMEKRSDYLEFMKDNFSAKMLDDKCGYLMLNAEGTDSTFHDLMGYIKGDHEWARETFRKRLSDLKAQGMEYLVVDLRNNMGGFDEIGCALCDLLTDKDWYGQGLGIRKNGKYTCVSDHGIHGTGEFADLKVIALTNYNCCSAGDGTALYLSKLPNVTLAGITDPCGCNQETGGICVLSDGAVCVVFPVGLVLDETGVPNVETRPDRISRNPVEVRIPLDREAAMKIFRDKEDYELEWAVNYLRSNG